MGLSTEQIEQAKRKSAATDPDAAPKVRIASASEAIRDDVAKRGHVTARTARVVRSVISKFKQYSSASLGVQRAIRLDADRLREELEDAIAAANSSEVGGEDTDETLAQEAPAQPETLLIGGIDLIPDPADEPVWRRFLAGLGYYQRLTKTELLAVIDVPLWIGECETVGRTPVNLRRPDDLRWELPDSELGWESSASWAIPSTREDRALYYAGLVARVHQRLNELGIETPAGVYVPLEELSGKLDVAFQKLEPPFITFRRCEAKETVALDLTDAGRKRRFINLLKARIRHGFDLYGRKQTTTYKTNLSKEQEHAAIL